MKITNWAFYPEAIGAHRFKLGATRNERNVLSAGCKPRSEITANTSYPNNCDPHTGIPFPAVAAGLLPRAIHFQPG